MPVWVYARYPTTMHMSSRCSRGARGRTSWTTTAPAPHEVGFRVGVFVQRHVSSSPHTCRAPWSALASCGCTCTPADRLGGVGASTSATPMGPVWVHARYSWSMYIPSVDAACVCECGGPTHDERRRAVKSHVWCLSDAAGACVGVRTLPNDHAYVICRCSMRVRVRRAHARRAAPCNRIARMVPQRRRWGLCGCMRATH
jgi:hypothetical protein